VIVCNRNRVTIQAAGPWQPRYDPSRTRVISYDPKEEKPKEESRK
jgi:hypothetical protein